MNKLLLIFVLAFISGCAPDTVKEQNNSYSIYCVKGITYINFKSGYGGSALVMIDKDSKPLTC